MEALTLTVVCREGRPPAHVVFVPDGCCPQRVPSWSPCPVPGPAGGTRAAALAGRAGCRRRRGGDRGLKVVRRGRLVGRQCRGRRAGRARSGPRAGGGVHVRARVRVRQSAGTVLGVLRERGRRGLPLEELYRKLFNPQLYLLSTVGSTPARAR